MKTFTFLIFIQLLFNFIKASFDKIPIVDIGELIKPIEEQNYNIAYETGNQIHQAFKNIGFMYIQNHGITKEFMQEIMDVSKEFFDQPQEEKMKLHMKNNGPSWRGYFEVGYELTSGIPDIKEGYYFGREHDKNSEGVQKGWPTFGSNVWPEKVPELKQKLPLYWDKLEKIAQSIFQGICLRMGLDRKYLQQRFKEEPVALFRLFNYPVHDFPPEADQYGVREHTDYGFLTILKQDNSGGLEVKSRNGQWIEAVPIEDTFVVNIGDILELWTHGIYRATPHRVRNKANHGRISIPYFYDPSWNSTLESIPKEFLNQEELEQAQQEEYRNQRWDGVDLSYISKDVTYGEHLWGKLSKVFPELAKNNVNQKKNEEL